MGAQVRAYDPAGMRQAQELLKDVTYCESAYACAEAADALVIATEWEQFARLILGACMTLWRVLWSLTSATSTGPQICIITVSLMPVLASRRQHLVLHLTHCSTSCRRSQE